MLAIMCHPYSSPLLFKTGELMTATARKTNVVHVEAVQVAERRRHIGKTYRHDWIVVGMGNRFKNNPGTTSVGMNTRYPHQARPRRRAKRSVCFPKLCVMPYQIIV